MEEFDKPSIEYLKGFNASHQLAKAGMEKQVATTMKSFKSENDYTRGFMDGAVQHERERFAKLKNQSKEINKDKER